MTFLNILYLNKLEKTPDVDIECEKLYDTTSDKIPESKEQYFVIFVFKNDDVKFDLDKYILTDFRLQRVHWGNVTRSKRVLFIEIQQLMCSYFKETGPNKIYFYFLSECEKGENESINNICKTQDEQINNIDNG